jgi:hypothetical protein
VELPDDATLIVSFAFLIPLFIVRWAQDGAPLPHFSRKRECADLAFTQLCWCCRFGFNHKYFSVASAPDGRRANMVSLSRWVHGRAADHRGELSDRLGLGMRWGGWSVLLWISTLSLRA